MILAEREGFEPSWGGKAPNRFRVGAVVTASVPLRKDNTPANTPDTGQWAMDRFNTRYVGNIDYAVNTRLTTFGGVNSEAGTAPVLLRREVAYDPRSGRLQDLTFTALRQARWPTRCCFSWRRFNFKFDCNKCNDHSACVSSGFRASEISSSMSAISCTSCCQRFGYSTGFACMLVLSSISL